MHSVKHTFTEKCVQYKAEDEVLKKKFGRGLSSSLPLSLTNFWVKRQILLIKWNAIPAIKKPGIARNSARLACHSLFLCYLPYLTFKNLASYI